MNDMFLPPPTYKQIFDDHQCMVGIVDEEKVTEIQVLGALRRHGIMCGWSAHLFGNGYAAFASAKTVAKILAAEAPPNLFSLKIIGQREFSEVAVPWSRGKSIGQLDKAYPSLKIAASWVKSGLPDVSDGGFEFRGRHYRGYDNKRRLAIEVRVSIYSHQFL